MGPIDKLATVHPGDEER